LWLVLLSLWLTLKPIFTRYVGKSTIARIFKENGVTVVDLDALARGVTAKGTAVFDRIVAAFGSDVVDQESGEINRVKLGALIFNDANKRRKLDSLTHRAILWETAKTLFSLFWVSVRGSAVKRLICLTYKERRDACHFGCAASYRNWDAQSDE